MSPASPRRGGGGDKASHIAAGGLDETIRERVRGKHPRRRKDQRERSRIWFAKRKKGKIQA